MSDYPPSLQVTPRRIRQYLLRNDVPCRKCGYSLLGLPEPRCPECGLWTDLFPKVRTDNLSRIKNRVGSLGTIDSFLVRRKSDEIEWAYRFAEVKSLDVVRRWGQRTRRWMILLGCLSMAVVLAYMALFVARPSEGAAFGAGVALLLGLVLLGLALDLEPQPWVLVHLTGRSHKVPLHSLSRADANAGVDRLRRLIEEGRDSPPTPGLDPAAEEVKEGCCHRCGYSLTGPCLTVKVPSQPAQALGVLAIVSSFFSLFCCGPFSLNSVNTLPRWVPCAATIAISSASFVLGIWLYRRTQEAPAVPHWEGPDQCPACGWRRTD